MAHTLAHSSIVMAMGNKINAGAHQPAHFILQLTGINKAYQAKKVLALEALLHFFVQF
jgi:hypothetical protein